MEPQQQVQSPIETPAQPTEQPAPETPLAQQPGRKSKKPLILIIVAILLVAGGAAAYLLTKDEPKVSDNTKATQATPQVKNISVIYSTKLGKTTKVSILDTVTNKTTEEVSFDESYAYEPTSGNYWQARSTSSDVNADGTELVYTKDSDIIVRNIKTDKEETVLESTLQAGSDFDVIAKTVPELPKVGGPGPSLIAAPVWSRDGKQIGFSIGHYEGGSIAVLDRSAKAFLSLGETFRYINQDGIPTKFTLSTTTSSLAKAGIFGSYLIEEYAYVNNPTISLDSKFLFTTVCPSDQPSTGSSTYAASLMTSAEVAENKTRTDCSEAGDWRLISINLSTGEYKTVGTGNFGTSLAQNSTAVFVGGSKDSGYSVTKIPLVADATSENLDIGKLTTLGSGETIDGIVLKNVGDTPIAEIHTTTAGKRAVKIMNLTSQKIIATIALETKSAYSTLSISE